MSEFVNEGREERELIKRPVASICTCPFCPNPPMPDDHPMPVMDSEGGVAIKPTHRYCILVEVLGQEEADRVWGERTRPYD